MMEELAKTVDGLRRISITKERLGRVAHDAGNADGRKDLPQGEIARDMEEPPAAVADPVEQIF